MTISGLDTNILVYAADEDALEHPKAIQVVDMALANPGQWMMADQVLFEFYKALRSPRVFRRPLPADEAAERIRFLRTESGFLRCCHELDHWEKILPILEKRNTPYQRTHDIVLGTTLRLAGVTRFFTRNTKDFEGMGFAELINPIDEPGSATEDI